MKHSHGWQIKQLRINQGGRLLGAAQQQRTWLVADAFQVAI